MSFDIRSKNIDTTSGILKQNTNMDSNNMEYYSIEVTSNHKWIWETKYACLYTGTKERKPHREASNKEAPKTNTEEIWFCCRKENHSLCCSERRKSSGCEHELACNVITMSPSLRHHAHPHTSFHKPGRLTKCSALSVSVMCYCSN